MVHSEPTGLGWDIVRRLNHLKEIETHLNANWDPDNQLPNAKALIKAYREEKLGWSRGWVSYWSNGVQLNKPQEFDAEFHKNLAEQHDTTKAWWVEGFPVDIAADSQLPGITRINIWTCHDTGADIMAVPQCYIDQLEAMGLPVYVQGYNIMDIPGGSSCHKVVEVDVRLTDPNGGPLSHWMRVQACVIQSVLGPKFGMPLSGPFLRFALYTATCPDGQGLLYVCDNKRDLRNLPALPNNFVRTAPPHLHIAPPAPGGGCPPQFLMQQVNAARLPPVPAPILPLPPNAPTAPAKKGSKKQGQGSGPLMSSVWISVNSTVRFFICFLIGFCVVSFALLASISDMFGF
ncbi:unnamed protein product [Penicillium nalgiovense]|uniref:Uncharacterized protein n=1 Tax=Penicillium nalgiovense TaxID=60175 RepID=A0A9W4MY35_PENNA|nr:unnamed protein product [Penicillium nalgiovense]CAG8198145.1 unnamed protein product [Penicillium nalgiovense]CAG8211793.1 unnamed protein product [Penicillium nalgiovense]CAG8217178.1 unnamed protein product [Penicillium nalgiovense]CAG8219041.1 unnamed protein product [Penicillium nalgiovense]